MSEFSERRRLWENFFQSLQLVWWYSYFSQQHDKFCSNGGDSFISVFGAGAYTLFLTEILNPHRKLILALCVIFEFGACEFWE